MVETSFYHLSRLDSRIIKIKRKNSINFGELWLQVLGKTTTELRESMNLF